MWGRFQLNEIRDTEKMEQDRSFYQTSVNARYDYCASGITWRRIVRVNETIEIQSLVNRNRLN